MDNLKSHWPAGYHLNRTEEKISSRPGLTITTYRYQYMDRRNAVLIYDSVTHSNSKLKTELGYSTFDFASQHSGDKLNQSVDYSSQIKAGDASQCRLQRDSGIWIFAYRKNRMWGALVIGGMKLEPQEMSRQVKAWVGRVEAAETRRKAQSRGLWPLFKKKP